MISLVLAQPPQGVIYVERVRAVEENERVLEELEAKEQAAQRGETPALPGPQVRVPLLEVRVRGWFLSEVGSGRCYGLVCPRHV